MRRLMSVAMCLCVISCTGVLGMDVDNGVDASAGALDDAGAPLSDASTDAAALSLVSPAAGSTHTRDSLSSLGALVASVNVVAQSAGPIVRVQLFADGVLLGQGLQATAQLAQAGPAQIMAVGYDANGNELARDMINVSVVEPNAATCHDWLDLYQLTWAIAGASPGVDLPVTVTTPINGVRYRYISSTNPRSTFFMHCELALALAKAAPIMRARNIVEVLDIGVYNYRCIGGVGTPPNCPNGISEHAYARAIDLAEFIDNVGTTYNLETDWIIDTGNQATCSAPTKNAKDAFLHELACTMKAEGVWNIVLTPNYNAGHRNHFHVDLKPGSDFIKNERTLGPISIPTVDHSTL